MSKPRILLLSAYRSDSHASWVDWLKSHLQADWQVLELPGRFFRWRIRGNPLSWLPELEQLLKDWQPQRILATSMVDIATIKGLCPALAAVPVSYYFHENQFAYPVTVDQHSSVDPQMVQLYGALAADELLFNSRFNQNSFLEGVDALLARLPDAIPSGIRQRLQAKCRWLPVVVKGCAQIMDKPDARVSSLYAGVRQADLILWNHRWEYDKCPQDFLHILQCLDERKVWFRLALLGPRGARVPAALEQIRQQFGERIVVDGRVSREEYWQWLQCSAVVVSTAIHEFQGLSMLEAASAGVIPLVPERLCYVEQYPSLYRYPVCVNTGTSRSNKGSASVRDSGSNKPASLPSIDVAAAANTIEQVFAGQLSAFWPADWLEDKTVPMWQNWLDSAVKVS